MGSRDSGREGVPRRRGRGRVRRRQPAAAWSGSSDKLVPSEADNLVAAATSVPAPGARARARARRRAAPLGRTLLERGDVQEALEVLEHG